MRILAIQAAYFPMIGGAEIFHQKTAEYLAKRGHQVDVITCIWDKPDVAWKGWKKNKEKINGVRIFRIKPWFYIQNLKSLGAIWPLYKKSLYLTKVENYDLVHAHIFPALIVGAMLKRKTGLPLVTTIQGGDLADYAETGKGISKILRPIIGWCLEQANIVHTVSTHMEKSVKRLGIESTKIIPNGVDANLFKPRNKKKLRKKYKISSKKFVIISHSRLTPKNGLDILIRALSKLPNYKEIMLLLIGDGEQRQELQILVRKLGVKKFVKFYGYQNRGTTAELLSLSDVFVRPSRQEGFGIAFLEAMASGLPVIGTRVGGIPDFVIHKENGLLIASEDVDCLTKGIKLFKADKKLRQRLGHSGRKMVLKKYIWSKICPQMEQMYNQISHFNDLNH